ncbi:alpha/beta-hydrolase [Russula vinacea]|nr:alpha/beta-hydrolase [Russula vinacea]
MWSPFTPLASLAAGLLSGFQHPLNTSHGAVMGLNHTDLSTFTPYIEFARAAYCQSNKLVGWKCGGACDALPGFMPTLTGGDGNGTQFFYVGYWPTQSAVVVAHQGTDPHKLLPVLTDVNFHFMALDPTLFPDIPSDIELHSGYVIEHMKTANQILAEVKRLMDEYSSTNVVLGTTIRGVTFGKPRLGNVAWATFFDSQVSNFTRINNKRDPVPVVPGRLLGFRHPATEIHIQLDGEAVICSDDGVDPECGDMMVPDVLEGNVNDHGGPYNGIRIGTQECTP